ncbi:hypothetical protein OJF2_64200 [Aquisphaera giovannonii]|uniref:Uncharacterized protein n=1 Tax=Aquisphaera giovannonii TaxID=406548 RepID=A0A5B9WC74_9BACT|nr:hypothetical protein [Aquisphaera giovannonii]QEH37829.1 hypothetical protein OJF2_64200 [Aquisphaera giovannonii]
MATEAQIQANRRNARLSTGPRTKRGKARSRRNGYGPGGRRREAGPRVREANGRGLEDRVAGFLESAVLIDSEEERALLRKAGELSWKIDEAERAECAYLERAVRAAEERHEAAEAGAGERAEELVRRLLQWGEAGDDDLGGGAREILGELEGSGAGRAWLIRLWRWVRDWVGRTSRFQPMGRYRLVRMLGYDPIDVDTFPQVNEVFRALNALDENGRADCDAFFARARELAGACHPMIRASMAWRELAGPFESAEEARAYLVGLADEWVGRLEMLQGETDADRADREALAASAAAGRLRREASAMSREFFKVLEDLRRVRKARPAAKEGEPATPRGIEPSDEADASCRGPGEPRPADALVLAPPERTSGSPRSEAPFIPRCGAGRSGSPPCEGGVGGGASREPRRSNNPPVSPLRKGGMNSGLLASLSAAGGPTPGGPSDRLDRGIAADSERQPGEPNPAGGERPTVAAPPAAERAVDPGRMGAGLPDPGPLAPAGGGVPAVGSSGAAARSVREAPAKRHRPGSTGCDRPLQRGRETGRDPRPPGWPWRKRSDAAGSPRPGDGRRRRRRPAHPRRRRASATATPLPARGGRRGSRPPGPACTAMPVVKPPKARMARRGTTPAKRDRSKCLSPNLTLRRDIHELVTTRVSGRFGRAKPPASGVSRIWAAGLGPREEPRLRLDAPASRVAPTCEAGGFARPDHDPTIVVTRTCGAVPSVNLPVMAPRSFGTMPAKPFENRGQRLSRERLASSVSKQAARRLEPGGARGEGVGRGRLPRGQPGARSSDRRQRSRERTADWLPGRGLGRGRRGHSPFVTAGGRPDGRRHGVSPTGRRTTGFGRFDGETARR